MIRVVAPMAGITNANFLNKVIPLGFDVRFLLIFKMKSIQLKVFTAA